MTGFHDQVVYAMPYNDVIATRTRLQKHDYALHFQYRVQARHYQMEIPILPFATDSVQDLSKNWSGQTHLVKFSCQCPFSSSGS
jgi:hypothetical protein